MPDSRPARFAPLVALAAGLALIALAVPRSVSGLLLAGVEDVTWALGRGERPSQARLAAAAARHRAALEWFDSPSIRTTLAALQLARATDPAMPPEIRRAFLDDAIASYRAGLAAGPTRPYAWLQLAQATLTRDREPARFGPALALSIETGPFEPPLVLARIAIGFRARSMLDEPTRRAIQEQALVAAAESPRRLAGFARDAGALGWIRGLLAEDQRLLRRFEAAYLSLPAR